MLPIVPYDIEEIRNNLKSIAVNEYGFLDAEFEGSNISKLIDLLAYSISMNNTNLAFGLNEIFITQAKDRRNIVKHALLMGYNYKRNISFQYKIRLKAKKEGKLTIPKYSTFSSGDNEYIYMNENINETFGTNVFLKQAPNDLYDKIEEGDIVITSDKIPNKVIEKSETSEKRLLLQRLVDEKIKVIDTTNIQYLMIHDGTYENGYRNFENIATIDTFLLNETDNLFKIQVSPLPDKDLPISHDDNYDTKVKDDNTLEDESPYPIDMITSIKLTKDGEDDVDIDIDDVELIDKDKNIQLPDDPNYEDYDAHIEYSYIYDNDYNLYTKFFFTDLRGVEKANETSKSDDNPNGWSGFYAKSYNSETNVLTFDVKQKDDGGYENEYVKIKNKAGEYEDAKPLNKVLLTPFAKTRLSMAKLENGEYVAEDDSVIGNIEEITIKDKLEIIVKEGKLQRYLDKDKNGNVLYPELTVNINREMVEAKHFTLYAPDIEQNGIEMFVSRIMPDGSIEKDVQWFQRDYLLSEYTDVNKTAKPIRDNYRDEEKYNKDLEEWEKNRVTETFLVVSNPDYEDYIDIYAKFAGTGTTLNESFIIKLNVLHSKGSKGFTNDLIKPQEDLGDDFETVFYDPEYQSPHITYIEGTDIESSESIKENAPKFSNTANRAVTKNDYKTICEAQPFIKAASVWGGEELPVKKPGHVFISVIPHSKPDDYNYSENEFVLNNINNDLLFYPSYIQITGKENYIEEKNNQLSNKDILFSILDKYRIITLQLDYTKAIYLDVSIDINILKYKFGQTIDETNKQIFDSIKTFFKEKIEKFETVFYKSSLTRHIDEQMGDDLGVRVGVNFTTALYDSYAEPEKGMFVNVDKKHLATPKEWVENPEYEGINYPGFKDLWRFEMFFSLPIEQLYESNQVVNGKIIKRGKIITDNLVLINTDDFITPGDRLHMLLKINDKDCVIGYDIDGNIEVPNSKSKRAEILIMYDKDGESYNVGKYIIEKNMIIFQLNTHGVKHIDNPDITDEDSEYYCPEETISVGGVDITYRSVPLPRDYFMDNKRILNIKAPDDNLKIIKNTYFRLKSVKYK